MQLIAVSQGISSDNEQSEMLVTVHGLVDSLYVRELAKKIHRGMEGLALRGLHTGGRTFGYETVTLGAGAGEKLVINPSEAEIVRRIFELSGGGQSLKRIARMLNAEHVQSPRARRDRVGGEWCPTAIREMLKNELYIGRVVWNRSKFVKVPGTNKRQRRMRPESEWMRSENSELAIVSKELWTAVRTVRLPAGDMGLSEKARGCTKNEACRSLLTPQMVKSLSGFRGTILRPNAPKKGNGSGVESPKPLYLN